MFQELSLGDIKSKLTRSARLAELKASLARFDEGRNKLNKIEQAKQTLQDSNPKRQLSQFSSIQLEVPVRFVLTFSILGLITFSLVLHYIHILFFL